MNTIIVLLPIVEPARTVAVAPLLGRTIPVDGLKVGMIVTGGNVDLDPLFAALSARWLGSA